ncbi:erythroferrone isoform X1 [Nerophis ophidion]|uniref:erythroferrone isoform X1 n=1 Tax=Nerophis ophidion TaxID=159077 RepID=UPI002AE040A1|nr:erythroferrone isoform X1 [Nerophis ophidion]
MLLLLRMMMVMMMMMSGSQEVVVQPAEVQDVSPASSWLMFLNNANKEASKRTPKGPPGPQGSLLPGQQQVKLADVTSKTCVRCERPPRVPASFLGRLPRAVNVPRRSLQELSGFRQASLFQRGQSFNASDGRFTAPLHAFYQLSANLLLQSGDRVLMRPRDNVRAAICLNSLCQSNLSIESVMGVANVRGAFRIFLTGMFFLQQAGEYVSIFVDNNTGSAVRVLPDSFFNGILLGA